MTFIRPLHVTIVNPLRPPLCPRCFKPVHPGLCQVVSLDDRKVLMPRPKGVMRVLKRTLVPQVWGDGFLRARRQCYNCHGLLPDQIECMDNQLIGLVGGQASGKSHYIASLVKQLEYDGVLKSLGMTEIQADDMYEQRYNTEYYDPLFRAHRSIEPARPGALRATSLEQAEGEDYCVEPLVYTLVFDSGGPSNTTRKVTLVLFDAAGEDMDTQEDIVRWTPYILNASALIFMLDPMTFPKMKDRIPAPYRPNVLPSVDGFKMMRNVVGILQKKYGSMPGDRLNIPVAVTMAKSDLLRFVVPLPHSNWTFMKPPSTVGGVDLGEMPIVDQEVRALLHNYGGQSIIDESAAFASAGFFAVSATGSALGRDQKYPKVEPLRCADPLAWLLQKLGVVH